MNNVKNAKAVQVIGAGLAGCEAAYQLAKRGVNVTLFEAKPGEMSPAHRSADFGELVCSNSLKSTDAATAHGLLKAEMRALDSLILSCADAAKIPAGGALAVDRAEFSRLLTERIKGLQGVTVVHKTVDAIPESAPTVIATGPLTLGKLADGIQTNLAGNLSFYDAAAPIVSAESIDMRYAFFANRYGKGGGSGEGDYLNCPLTRDEYYAFIDALGAAERVILKDFEKEVFEGCMPVEVMAARGRDALRFGPLKPVGITDPVSGKWPFAVVQLRKETADGHMYNLVGFQTNLKFGEQKRVFGMIPALKSAEFYRYGVMHKNAYVNAPLVLDRKFRVKAMPHILIAGQLSGVEGYVESAASGLMAGIYAAAEVQNKTAPDLPPTTMMGALCRYLETPNPDFTPMNANFGLLPPLDIRDKQARKQAYAERSLADLAVVLPALMQI
jgi:methylenetetrahydrofolate--tRNA-(uracil-5-)-methyltransferase